jgi:hypothetical protein
MFYFYTTLDAYADGAVDCWGLVDLPLFRRKVAEGWVVARPPVGSQVSFHNLGRCQVAAAEWTATPADLVAHVEAAVRELNAGRGGLIDLQGEETELRGQVRYSKLGLADDRAYRVDGGTAVIGSELPVFQVERDDYRLTHWFIYADGLAQIGYGTDLAQLKEGLLQFDEGRLTTSVPDGAWVIIDGLGRFQVGAGSWFVDRHERVREAVDLIDKLNGRPDAVLRCRMAHEAYEDNPSEEMREALRQAYEAVPVHLRPFCGDMDTKDQVICNILYGMED